VSTTLQIMIGNPTPRKASRASLAQMNGGRTEASSDRDFPPFTELKFPIF